MTKQSIHAALMILALAVLAGCSGGSDGGGMTQPAAATLDGDWSGSASNPSFDGRGGLKVSLTESGGRVGGIYSLGFKVRNASRYGSFKGSVSGSRRGDGTVTLTLEDVKRRGCHWYATLNAHGELLTGPYSGSGGCDSGERGDIELGKGN